MKLVEAEADGPVEGDDPLVTPPRPPHRRVSVSLLLTISVLVGTVVTIYLVFPPRHNVLMTEAMDRHRDPGTTWDLTTPNATELHAWLLGAVGHDVPTLPAGTTVLEARTVEVLNRRAALMTVRIDASGERVTYLVQRARGFIPEHAERVEDGLEAIEWRTGTSACVAVGPEASVAGWRVAVGAK